MKTASLPQLPALNGLRGIAIILVLGYHLNLAGCGWVGVQLFFVLSGFLITRQLLQGHEGQSLGLRLKGFYSRRALRILPLYYLYLIAALLLAETLTPGHANLEGQWRWAAGFGFNAWSSTVFHEQSWWLDHLWSLAVEAQFYLLWPWVIYALPQRLLGPVLLALVLLAPLLRFIGIMVWSRLPWADNTALAHAVAVGSVSHLDAFALGALALLWQQRLSRLRHPGWWMAAALLLAWLPAGLLNGWGIAPGASEAPFTLGYPNTLPRHGQFLWGYSLINLVAALAVGLVAAGRLGARLLAARWLCWVGLVSYAAYLFHFPLAHGMSPLVGVIAAATGLGTTWSLLLFAPLYLAALFLLAGCSYYGYERYFLRLKKLP